MHWRKSLAILREDLKTNSFRGKRSGRLRREQEESLTIRKCDVWVFNQSTSPFHTSRPVIQKFRRRRSVEHNRRRPTGRFEGKQTLPWARRQTQARELQTNQIPAPITTSDLPIREAGKQATLRQFQMTCRAPRRESRPTARASCFEFLISPTIPMNQFLNLRIRLQITTGCCVCWDPLPWTTTVEVSAKLLSRLFLLFNVCFQPIFSPADFSNGAVNDGAGTSTQRSLLSSTFRQESRQASQPSNGRYKQEDDSIVEDYASTNSNSLSSTDNDDSESNSDFYTKRRRVASSSQELAKNVANSTFTPSRDSGNSSQPTQSPSISLRSGCQPSSSKLEIVKRNFRKNMQTSDDDSD